MYTVVIYIVISISLAFQNAVAINVHRYVNLCLKYISITQVESMYELTPSQN